MAIFLLNTSSTLPEMCKGLVHPLSIEMNLLAKLERYTQADEENIILYQDPSQLLAAYLEVEQEVDSAIITLQTALKNVVDFYKKNRANYTLMNVSAGEASEKLGHETYDALLSLQPPIDAFTQLIANTALQNNKELSKQVAELSACTSGTVEAIHSPDLNALLNQYRDAQQNQQNAKKNLAEQVEQKTQENESLVESLHHIQEQFETKLQELSHLQQGLDVEQQARQAEQNQANAMQAELENKLTKAEEEHKQQLLQASDKAAQVQSQLQAQVTETQQENDLLIEQLHQVQEQFETKLQELSHLQQGLDAENQARQAEQAKANTVQAELEDQLANAKEQHKQELTKAATKEQLAEQVKQQLESDLKDVKQENDLIIEQLHYVQELLEQEYGVKERQRLRIAELTRDKMGLEKQLRDADITQLWLRNSFAKANKRLWARNRTFRNEIKKQVKLLQNAAEFDETQYLEMYPDLKDFSLDAATHYLLFGALEARNPSAMFNTLNYIQAYPDVSESGMNPLLHFIKFGQFEGRKANPMQLRLPAPKS